jgi:sortase A
MSVRLLFEEATSERGTLWRLSRGLLFVVGMVALGFSGWIYLDGYRRQHSESEAFDRAREDRAREEGSAARQAAPRARPGAVFPTSKLKIPRLGLWTMVEEGVGEDTLRGAAGHIPHTAVPGRPGNIGIAAHRDTLFRGLRKIRMHDRIVLSTVARDYHYEVESTSIVDPSDVAVLSPSSGENTLTLVTCYPFYFIGDAPKRFIVRARQVDKAGRSAPG